MNPYKIPYRLVDFSHEVKSMSSQWDMTLIKDLLDGEIWQPAFGYEFFECDEYHWKDMFGGVLVLPGRQNAGLEDKVQKLIDTYEWLILIVTGDEEQSFKVEKLKHDHMRVWLMHPTLDRKADYYIGSGYTPDTRKELSAYKSPTEKPLDWFFAGQNNHPRREGAADVLRRMLTRDDMTGKLVETKGFTQGLSHEDYYTFLASAKAVPAPAGIQVPDSFRVYEALEAGAVPIADDISHVLVHEPGYWDKVFNEHGTPFKVYDDTANLEGYISDVKREFPALNNRVFAWWQNVKRDMVLALNSHINEVITVSRTHFGSFKQYGRLVDKITIIILTSPISRHPSTEIIDQTIRDVRAKLPDCEIIIGIDGVRPEQEDYRERYEQYKQNLLWKCNFEWHNVLPVAFEEHQHQAVMTKQLLKLVKTPTILFVEHDTAITPDYNFDWDKLVEAIESGEAYMIRFNHEAAILPEHEHMMLGGVEDVCGTPMRKTYQWSQRPHLASTAFYKDMLDRYFTDESRTMIEDVVHGKLISAYQDDGMAGWYRWRVWVYCKDDNGDGNIKRSYTSDGRGDDPKFEMRF